MNNNTGGSGDSGSSSGDDDDLSDGDTRDVQIRRARRSTQSGGAASSAAAPRWNPTTNPFADNKVKLHSRTRHFLGAYADGSVRGTEDRTDLHIHLELVSLVGFPGHLQIKALLTHQYIAMNHKGRVYATADASDDNTVFIQGARGLYQTYLSRQFAAEGWYLAIKRNGKMKNGKKTAERQKAAQFLSVRRNEYFQY